MLGFRGFSSGVSSGAMELCQVFQGLSSERLSATFGGMLVSGSAWGLEVMV